VKQVAKSGNALLNPQSQRIEQYIKSLKEIDFELAYLALLTAEGLKPLSRWEKPLDEQGLELLRQIGLITKQVRRTVKTGKDVVETIFSCLPGYIQLYERYFANTPIDKSAQTQRIEGFLFGYPACCVDAYISQPYAPNNLPNEEQKILFYWACKGCEITPLLLPFYRGIHKLLNNC
jgi:hypothetical protein